MLTLSHSSFGPNEGDSLEVNAQKFMQALNGFGLPLGPGTGGQHKANLDHGKWSKLVNDQFRCTLPSGRTITFLDGFVFMKSIETTEKAMNIKLYL